MRVFPTIALVRANNEKLSKDLGDLKQKYDELLEGKGLMKLLHRLAEEHNAMSQKMS